MNRYKPYEFKAQDAYDFANYMHIKAAPKRGELHFYKCPMCGGKTTDKETFAINLKTGQFKCLRASCGYQGNMITLAQDFDFSLGTEVDEYFTPKKQFVTHKRKSITPTDRAVEYMKSRGISEAVTRRYEITTRSDMPNVLVIPFAFGDEWKMVKYRKTDFVKGRDKNKEWCEPDGQPILFGMQNCNLENKTLIITEGQIDSLSVTECNIENAVSVPHGCNGFTWVSYCWDWMQNFDTIIVFGDYEKGSMSLLDDIRSRFRQRIKHVRYEDYKGCKDANDILRKYGKEQIRHCIANAEEEPIKQIVKLSSVKTQNPWEIQKVRTGFKELDDLLYGGLPFGMITLITGKTGEGKSVLASQILLNALDSGHRVFAYSGELPKGNFKAITMLQAAGSHLFKYKTRDGYEGYNVSETNENLINSWLGDRFDLYDDSMVEDEPESLTSIMEKCIVRDNVDVLLLDNLMIGLDLETFTESNKYDRQGKFVKRLTRIAVTYNVLIILVAHYRKNNGSANGNDEVAGSSDITNLCGITLMYEADKDISPDQRLLKVWKNRLFGIKNTKGWVMDYDAKSKRIYGQHDDMNREFGWAKEIKTEFEDINLDEIPFD